jgi:aldehyde dehydrogenase (NAD+)
MGPSVDAGQMETVLGYLEIARKEGSTFLRGGERMMDQEHARGFFVPPTVMEVTPEMTVAREELFGPALSILKARDFAEALQIANDVRFGLSASIYTADVTRAFEFIEEIEVGIVHVNSPTVGGEAQLPFGGVKETGIGQREQGSTAIEFYTELKTVYIDFTGAARQTKIY